MQHMKKVIYSFYKKQLEKPTVISPLIDSVVLIARPTIKLTKQKEIQLTKSGNEYAKNQVLDAYNI